ncbi:MAG TPA: nucleotidyltransferase family protein [Candidatus Hydrogenedentes bacterium]|nr:nucleotidyltransferase family protein [Candidatus Hydrogenedentota bacterium]
MKNLELDKGRIAAFCRKWDVEEMSLFGSVLRDDFHPESDIDVLVSFAPGAVRTLFDLVRMRDELAVLLERPVDIVSRRGLEAAGNPLRRESILSSAELVYGP